MDRSTEPFVQERSSGDLTKRNIDAIVELEEEIHRRRTSADRVADAIASFCGSMAFVWVHVAWFAVWIVANVLSGKRAMDPFPFTFLTLCVSLEAIFLSAFILISQNRDMRISERRSHLDLQINLLSEQENTRMLSILKSIAQTVGANVDDANDGEHELEAPTDAKKLAMQIDEQTGEPEA